MSARNQLWLLVLPPMLYGISLYSDPFGSVLAEKKIVVSALTAPQKLNIAKAASKIDGKIVMPGEEFSFNKVVGPRTNERGYFSAPAYVGSNTYNSPGGGICVISSGLYQDALLAGLKVSQRVAHNRTMQTVEPGLDATVWYGGADLKFLNDTGDAIKLQCKIEDGYLTTSITGDKKSQRLSRLSRREFDGGNNQVGVEVFQESKDHASKLISRDLYLLSSRARPRNLPKLSWSQPSDAVSSSR